MNGYYCPGSARISKGQRITLADRIRMWKRRRERMKEMIYPWH